MRDDAVLGRALPLDRGLGPNVTLTSDLLLCDHDLWPLVMWPWPLTSCCVTLTSDLLHPSRDTTGINCNTCLPRVVNIRLEFLRYLAERDFCDLPWPCVTSSFDFLIQTLIISYICRVDHLPICIKISSLIFKILYSPFLMTDKELDGYREDTIPPPAS